MIGSQARPRLSSIIWPNRDEAGSRTSRAGPCAGDRPLPAARSLAGRDRIRLRFQRAPNRQGRRSEKAGNWARTQSMIEVGHGESPFVALPSRGAPASGRGASHPGRSSGRAVAVRGKVGSPHQRTANAPRPACGPLRQAARFVLARSLTRQAFTSTTTRPLTSPFRIAGPSAGQIIQRRGHGHHRLQLGHRQVGARCGCQAMTRLSWGCITESIPRRFTPRSRNGTTVAGSFAPPASPTAATDAAVFHLGEHPRQHVAADRIDAARPGFAVQRTAWRFGQVIARERSAVAPRSFR